MGSAFVQAEQTYHISAAYLVAHAILETGWGTSTLAMGQDHQGTIYYNFFGIGAYDGVADSAGLSMAVNQGWTRLLLLYSGALSGFTNITFTPNNMRSPRFMP